MTTILQRLGREPVLFLSVLSALAVEFADVRGAGAAVLVLGVLTRHFTTPEASAVSRASLEWEEGVEVGAALVRSRAGLDTESAFERRPSVLDAFAEPSV